MADKKDYDEEYHFTDDESQEDPHNTLYESNDDYSQGTWIQKNLKRIVLPVAILSIIVGFGGYKYYKSHSISAATDAVLVPPVSIPDQNAQSEQATPVPPAAPMPETPDAALQAQQQAMQAEQEKTQKQQALDQEQNKRLTALLDAKEQMDMQVAGYQKQVEQLQQTIQDLSNQNQNYQSQVSSLQNSLVGMQQHLDEYTKNMEKKLSELTVALNQNFYALHAELDKLEPQVQHAAKYINEVESAKKRVEALNKRKHFNVQALLPKRAWLRAEDGTTITVNIGQEVPGYGTVSSIDVSTGTVATSTGEVFHFG